MGRQIQQNRCGRSRSLRRQKNPVSTVTTVHFARHIVTWHARASRDSTSASLMSAMMASAGATRVATAARAVNSAKRTTSARAVSAASTGKRAAAAGRSAQFFQGDRNPSVELRQRHVSATVSHRSMAKRTVTASATPVPAVQSAAPTEWKGAKLKPLGFSVLAGLIIWCIPAPEGVSAQAWHLLAVFVGTIVGIITNVRPCSLAPLLRPKHLSSKPSVLLTPDLAQPFDIAASPAWRHRPYRSRRLDGHGPPPFLRCVQRVRL